MMKDGLDVVESSSEGQKGSYTWMDCGVPMVNIGSHNTHYSALWNHVLLLWH
jgi:hypothetical protein